MRRFARTCVCSVGVFFGIRKLEPAHFFILHPNRHCLYGFWSSRTAGFRYPSFIWIGRKLWPWDVAQDRVTVVKFHFFRFISIFIQTKIVYTYSTRLDELISDHLILFRSDQKWAREGPKRVPIWTSFLEMQNFKAIFGPLKVSESLSNRTCARSLLLTEKHAKNKETIVFVKMAKFFCWFSKQNELSSLL